MKISSGARSGPDTRMTTALVASDADTPGPHRPIIRRAAGAVVTNGISSIGNLALSIAIAHIGTLAELGQDGVALAVYVLASGIVRATVTDTVLTQQHSADLIRRSVRRVALMGLVAAALTCGVGLILSQTYILFLGCAMPGIVVYDYLKLTNLGNGSVRRAMVQECSCTVVTLIFVVLGLAHRLDGPEVFAGWALSCAAIGVTHGAILRCDFRPGWNVDRAETKVGLTFALDFAAGSGTAQVTTMAVAAAGGVVVAGALRGAGTILAPLMIISSTLPSLLLPYLATARRSGPEVAFRTSRMLGLVAIAVSVPIVAALLAIPSGLGHILLGTNWTPSRAVLPMIAIEVVFTILGAIPFCGHRVERAGTRALVIRLARAPFHIGAVVASAALFGAIGAAWAMAAMSMLGAVSWWISYRQLLRNGSAEAPEPDSETPVAQPAMSAQRLRSDRVRHPAFHVNRGHTALLRLWTSRSEYDRNPNLPRKSSPTIEGVGPTRHQPRPPRFPMTSLLVLQYGVLAVWPAWRNHNPALSFIVWIVCLGTVASLFGEFLGRTLRIRRSPRRRTSTVSPRSAAVITIIGFVALFASAAFGARTYAGQVGLTAESPLAKLATPFAPWALVGTGLSLYCWARGSLSRRATLMRIGLAVLGYVGYSLSINITAPLAKFLLAVAIGALITSLVRMRWLLVGLLVAFLIWPTLYNLRNASRQAITASGFYGQTVSASDRLREDILLGLAASYPAPIGIETPSWPTLLRYGAIPSAIDPFHRPDLLTAKQLSVATGGSPTNSMTFTIYGNIRAISGTPALVVVMLALGLMIGRFSTRSTPTRLIVVMATAQSIMWIESMYPDGLSGILQTVVSAWIALLCVAIARQLGFAVARRRAVYANTAIANPLSIQAPQPKRQHWRHLPIRQSIAPTLGRPVVARLGHGASRRSHEP